MLGGAYGKCFRASVTRRLMALQTMRAGTTLEEARPAFLSRLDTLSKAQNLLTRYFHERTGSAVSVLEVQP